MHIPPYHKKETWQRFIVGVVLGAILGYIVLIYMYGSMYKDLLGENLEFESQIKELTNQNEALLEEKDTMDEKSKEPITVDTIEVKLTNVEELRLDRLIVHQLEELIKEEINHIIGQDIKIVAESDQLLISTIENKAFSIDDFTYYFDVTLLTVISNTIKITVDTKLSN